MLKLKKLNLKNDVKQVVIECINNLQPLDIVEAPTEA